MHVLKSSHGGDVRLNDYDHQAFEVAVLSRGAPAEITNAIAYQPQRPNLRILVATSLRFNHWLDSVLGDAGFRNAIVVYAYSPAFTCASTPLRSGAGQKIAQQCASYEFPI